MKCDSDDRANQNPRCLDAQQILQQFDFIVGGRLVEQQLNCDFSLIQKNLDGSGQLAASAADISLLQPTDLRYTPQSIVRATGANAVYKKFQIRLQVKKNSLFGYADEKDAKTDVMLPLFAFPRTQLTLFFKRALDVVTTDTVGQNPSYVLRNLQLSCSYIESESLMAKMMQTGFRGVWESYSYMRMNIGTASGGSRISLQMPSSFASVNSVVGRFKVDGNYDETNEDRNKLGAGTVGFIDSANIRLNSKRRYREDLDGFDVLRELRLNHPQAHKSSFLQQYGVSQSHTIWSLLCGGDHFDGKFLSGYASNNSVGMFFFLFIYSHMKIIYVYLLFRWSYS